MASWDVQFLSHIVRHGQSALSKALQWGVTVDDFRTAEGQSLWSHLLQFYNQPQTRGAVPGKYAWDGYFPHFEIHVDDSMTTEALCYELRRQRIIMASKESASQFAEKVESDHVDAVNWMQKKMSTLQALSSSKQTDISFSVAIDEIVNDYHLAEKGEVDTARAKWPWPFMNQVTQGIQEDDYIVLYGRPKSMKTWVLAWILAYHFDMDKKILLYTKEMTPKNIMKRIVGCVGRLPYHELRSGQLEPSDRRQFMDAADEIRKRPGQFICLSGGDVAAGGDTVQWIQSKVEQYRPDICYIDGLYLLSDNSGSKTRANHEKVMAISRATRAMILQTRTPVICTLQANRAAAKHNNAQLDEIAYSDAIGQDATIALRVMRDKATSTLALAVAGSREFELHGIRINARPATDFTFREELSEKDIVKAQENDKPGDEAPNPRAHAKKREPATSQSNGHSDMNKVIDKRVDQHFQK